MCEQVCNLGIYFALKRNERGVLAEESVWQRDREKDQEGGL